MIKLKKVVVAVFLLAVVTPSFAQEGFLKGLLIDDESGEPLIGATVSVKGTTKGTVADFNGNYSLALEPGIYDIVYQFVSYQSKTVRGIEIKAEEITSMDIRLANGTTQLQTVVVTAEVTKSSEMGMLIAQKKAPNLIDGISSQGFKKIGDGNLATAMKRVTGVSVQDGKYIYVRGLGDRYTKTTLNGMPVPGLDPDNNAVQIDLFPTSTIENVVVYKTFSPDLMGDFTGGTVNVETKEFPEEKITSFSFGLGFNPQMNLIDHSLLYEGGSLDYLGFDDGTRSLPVDIDKEIPHVVLDNPELETITRQFNPQLAAERYNNLLNTSFSLNHGNQVNKKKYSLGYNAVINYQNSYEYFGNTHFGDYLKSTNPANTALQPFEERTGEEGRKEVLWSALLSGALKFDNHNFSASLLRSQNGISKAADRISRDFEQTGATLLQDILTYSQRSMINGRLMGKHDFEVFNIEWHGAVSYSNIYEPDFRTTSISITDHDTTLNVGDGAGINRFWRNLDEMNYSGKIDITIPFAEQSKVKIGGIALRKERDFEVLNYLFRVTNPGDVSVDPDWFLQGENIWSAAENAGTYIVGNFEPANSFSAFQYIFGGYAMSDMKITEKLRAIYGVRVEKTQMYYSGQNNMGTEVYNEELTLDELDLLPSVNIVYTLQDEMNIRGSFTRTLARPTFKEKSIAQIYDPISDRTFVGNLHLDQTYINNMDLRWEYFFKRGEIISISTFYKLFYGHIELASFDVAPDNIKPRNAGESVVYGTEIELRKSLEFLSPRLSDISIGTNVSLVKSAIKLNSVEVNNSGETEFELRQKFLREGETIAGTRSMAGQAPYLINTYINYANMEKGINANLAYNVQGETLTIVGSGRVPDVYTKPFHSLNLNVYKDLGAQKKSRITVGVNNILGNANELVFKSYKAEDVIYSIYRPGTTFNFKYGYTF